jgi:hypothetical protein
MPNDYRAVLRGPMTRRQFLQAGSIGVGTIGASLAAGLANAEPTHSATATRCILLFLVGGPSQLDTWDLKPDAPSHIRGPFRPIRTNMPGIDIGECFPRMAAIADKFALVRSIYHDEAAIHETGQQLVQTGHLSSEQVEYPHVGAALSHLRGPASVGIPPFVLLPHRMGNTGVPISHGQSAGFLGRRHQPCTLRDLREVFATTELEQEPFDLRARYGPSPFGQSCLLARRLIERGVRLVTVNMFDTVFHTPSWDCHADGDSLATTLTDYRDTVCPMFDWAYSALLTDLDQRGLLATTLVVAAGEFGRTPALNPRGGRDHWPGVWTSLFAGGGIRGGQVIGSSDAYAGEPRDQPIQAAAIAATVYRAFGHDSRQASFPLCGGDCPLTDEAPVCGLF